MNGNAMLETKHKTTIFVPWYAEAAEYTGWPKKVRHYRESSLNRIKNRQTGYTFHQFLL